MALTLVTTAATTTTATTTTTTTATTTTTTMPTPTPTTTTTHKSHGDHETACECRVSLCVGKYQQTIIARWILELKELSPLAEAAEATT